MAEALFKTGEFAGFRVHDAFAVAANNETKIVFNVGSIPWPDGLEPTQIPLGSHKPGQTITGPVDFQADVLILLYTEEETSGFLEVFTGNKDWSASRRDTWYPYGHNFAKLSSIILGIKGDYALEHDFFGYLNAMQIGNQKVAVFKTELHAKVNGNKLPIIPVIQQLVTEVSPSLVLSTGTAGGMGSVVMCGDVVVTSSARFRVDTTYPTYPQINTLSKQNTPVTNSVSTNDKYLNYAAENLTKLSLPGLASCYSKFSSRPGYSFLKKNTAPPKIYVTDINPVPGPEPMAVVTADFLSVDDTTDAEGLEPLGIVNENDDAYAFFAIDQMPAGKRPAWLSVRNVSDPQVKVPPIPPGTSNSQVIK
jgi:hypothetical protein